MYSVEFEHDIAIVTSMDECDEYRGLGGGAC